MIRSLPEWDSGFVDNYSKVMALIPEYGFESTLDLDYLLLDYLRRQESIGRTLSVFIELASMGRY